MRGPRFRRPTTKKLSAKEKREQREESLPYYQEPEQVDPSEVVAKTLNALEHLGNQRFGLPPYSEHYRRWVKDMKALLEEFETQLQNAADQQYRETVDKSLAFVKEEFDRRMAVEAENSVQISSLQKRLDVIGIELSKLEHEYKIGVNEFKKRNEKTAAKLRGEIDTLDKKRLQMIRKKPSLFERLFKKPDLKLESNTSVLRSKKEKLSESREGLKAELTRMRAEYEKKRRQLTVEQEELRTKLARFKEGTSDETLERRRQVCQELRRAIIETVERTTKHAPQDVDIAEGS